MGCLTRIGCAVVLITGLGAGYWLYGDRLPSVLGRAARGAATSATDAAVRIRYDSVEAAQRLAAREAERRAARVAADAALGWELVGTRSKAPAALAPLRRRSGPAYVSLSARETADLLVLWRRALPVPPTSLAVALRENELLVRADLARKDFASDAAVRTAIGVTLDGRDTLQFAGVVQGVRPGLMQYRVRELYIRGVEVPPRFIPLVLRVLRGTPVAGATARDSLPPDAVPIPMPSVVRDLRLENGRLVLYRAAIPEGK